MKKISLNSFELRLNRDQMRMINGGLRTLDGTVCKATCCDGSLVGVMGCSTIGTACESSGGLDSCKCDYPGPLDPPGA